MKDIISKFFAKLLRRRPRFISCFGHQEVIENESGWRFARGFGEEDPRVYPMLFGSLAAFFGHGATRAPALMLYGTMTCKPYQKVIVISNDGWTVTEAELLLMFDPTYAIDGRWIGYIYFPGERMRAVEHLNLDITDRMKALDEMEDEICAFERAIERLAEDGKPAAIN